MTTLAEIAVVLETTEKNAIARAKGLKILPVCERCGGSGSYSFNQIDGSKCYGCNGSGCVEPKAADLDDVFEAAIASKENGKFNEYMSYLEAVRTTKDATKKVLNAWAATGIGKAYDWRKACGTVNKVWLSSKSETYKQDVIAFAAVVEKALSDIAEANEELMAYVAAQ